MARRRWTGLGMQLSLGTLSLGLLCSFAAWFFIERDHDARLDERIDDAIETAPRAAIAAIAPRYNDVWHARGELQASCERLGSMPGVKWIEVFSNEAEVIAHTDRNRVGHPPLGHHRDIVLGLLAKGGIVEERDEERQRYNHFEVAESPDGTILGVVEIVLEETSAMDSTPVQAKSLAAQALPVVTRTLMLERTRTEELQAIAARFGKLRGIAWVEVFDAQARVIAHTIEERLDKPPKPEHAAAVQTVLATGSPQIIRDGGALRFDPIFDGDRVVGVVEIVLDHDHLAGPLNAAHRTVIITLALAFSALALAIAFFVHLRINRPLTRLSEKIRRGEEPAEEVSDNEIGDIERSYRALLEELDASEDHHQELQRNFDARRIESIGHLAGGMAHDFNNLLTIIMAGVHILKDDSEEDQGKRELLDEMEKAVERGARLASKLLSYGQRQPLRPESVFLHDFIDGLRADLAEEMGAGITLDFALDAPGVVLRVDPDQLRQVFYSLCYNARDAMPDGGSLSVRTSVCTPSPALLARHGNLSECHYACIEFRDQGTGIPEDIRDKVFDPYFTTKGPSNKGSGLSLSAAQGLVAQSGGLIDFDSIEGHGTTFRILLPPAESDTGATVEAKATTDVQRPSTTLLIVDDEERLAVLAGRLLASKGYEILTAHSGSEALRVAKEHEGRIDLLLTDVLMPNMNGPELAQAYLKQYPGTPVVYMSGYSADQLVDVELDADQLLQKPFTPASLEDAIVSNLAPRPRLRLVRDNSQS